MLASLSSRRRAGARLGLLGILAAVFVSVAACTAASTAAPNPAVPPGGAFNQDQTSGSGAAGSSGADTTKETASNPSDVLTAGSQVVWTGSLQLQVDDVQAAVDGARTAVAALGGYVASSKASAGDNQPVAVITYRIPADKWEAGLAALRKLARKVIDEATNSSDVTGQLVDIDARLKNLRAAETALQDIASKATKVSDVLEVQTRLTDVRGQIESLAAQQKALADRVAYATVTVTYGLQLGAVTEASRRWDPAREVDTATAQLVAVLQGIAGAGIWFVIVWLPVLLILGIVALLAIRTARRLGLGLPPLGRGPTGGAGIGAGGGEGPAAVVAP